VELTKSATPLRIWIFAAIAALSATSTLAQNYPVKPIRFVTGGGPDAMARILGPKMTATWGQQIVIEERGGGGILSGETVARASADGYTLLLATTTHTMNPNFFKLTYDLMRDFAPVTLLGKISFVLSVHPSVPVKSIDELIRLARAKPGQLNAGSGGTGSPAHLIIELFKSRTGVNIVHVPYKTVAQGVTALIGNEVQLMFVVSPSAVPQIQAGRIRPLAVSTLTRSASLPDVPTVAESGLPGFDAPAWNGVLVPARTPVAVIMKLHAELVRDLMLPDVLERIAVLGFEPVGNTPQEFGVFLRAELVKWSKVAKEIGAKAE